MLTLSIQAGGQSRRMGQDKALIPFLGEPLITRLIRRREAVADELIITTNRPEAYAFLNRPLFPDTLPERGALGGLYTALASASSPLVAVVACDMPFASPALIRYQQERLLDGNFDAVIPCGEDGLEPLHALYRRETCLPAILRAIQADKWKVISWFDEVRVCELTSAESNPLTQNGLAFLNLNTPEDVARAESLARSEKKLSSEI